MKPIVVVGSINMDLVTQTQRMPQPGETVIGNSFQTHSGGKGANQAVAVARLGHPCILLGAIGHDSFGKELLQILGDYGVDTQHIKQIHGSSGTASIIVDAKGENMIIVTPGANLGVTPDYLREHEDVLCDAGMILAQLEVPLETVEWLGDFCWTHSIPFMLDPAPAQPLPDSLLRKVTWFTPNETEVDSFVSRGEDEEVLHALFARGVGNVILKRGAKGSLIACQEGDPTYTQAANVQAIDTTAAGDSFNGAFAVSLMDKASVTEAARFATAAAGISVTRDGAQASLPTRNEISFFLSSKE